MALGASLSFAAVRAGILGGLGTVDIIFARFVVAAAIMLRLLVHFGVFDLAGIGLRHGLVLALLGGAIAAPVQTRQAQDDPAQDAPVRTRTCPRPLVDAVDLAAGAVDGPPGLLERWVRARWLPTLRDGAGDLLWVRWVVT